MTLEYGYSIFVRLQRVTGSRGAHPYANPQVHKRVGGSANMAAAALWTEPMEFSFAVLALCTA
eukprot:scaffold73534_cov36-Tisochrysis_lutea.AAC.2